MAGVLKKTTAVKEHWPGPELRQDYEKKLSKLKGLQSVG